MPITIGVPASTRRVEIGRRARRAWKSRSARRSPRRRRGIVAVVGAAADAAGADRAGDAASAIARPIRPRAPRIPIVVVALAALHGRAAPCRKRNGTAAPRGVGAAHSGKRRAQMAEREREVIVTNDGGGSGAASACIAGVILAARGARGACSSCSRTASWSAAATTDINADIKIERRRPSATDSTFGRQLRRCRRWRSQRCRAHSSDQRVGTARARRSPAGKLGIADAQRPAAPNPAPFPRTG